MNIEEIREHSRITKNQADKILKETNLIEVLSAMGTPHIIGSYAMDLMYNPDLDIIVVSDDIRASSVAALNRIVERKIVQKLEYGDFVTFKRDKRPEGYIIVLKMQIDGVKWEVEIWFLPSADKEERDIEHVSSRVTKKMRDTILEFKHLAHTGDISKYTISSTNIYEAVVDKGIEDFEMLVEKYAEKK